MRLLILLLAAFAAGCVQSSLPETAPAGAGENFQEVGIMKLSSPSFENNAVIPEKFTCEAEDVNPEFLISGVPEGVKSLVLIVDDPDAPPKVWEHWTLWNIPPDTERIPENSVPQGAVQGMNDFKRVDWGGPCPPPGKVHNYKFKLYALDAVLTLDSSAGKSEVEKAMQGHVLEETVLTGTYQR